MWNTRKNLINNIISNNFSSLITVFLKFRTKLNINRIKFVEQINFLVPYKKKKNNNYTTYLTETFVNTVIRIV